MNQPTNASAEAASTEVSLRHSLKDAAAYAVMMGIGETYLSAFALFLKASTPQIGLLASLPPLLGSLAQIVSAWLGRLAGRRKPIILAGAGLQALAWLPITLLRLRHRVRRQSCAKSAPGAIRIFAYPGSGNAQQ
jgi:MFS family permease